MSGNVTCATPWPLPEGCLHPMTQKWEMVTEHQAVITKLGEGRPLPPSTRPVSGASPGGGDSLRGRKAVVSAPLVMWGLHLQLSSWADTGETGPENHGRGLDTR